jgi:hypothetical protein
MDFPFTEEVVHNAVKCLRISVCNIVAILESEELITILYHLPETGGAPVTAWQHLQVENPSRKPPK